MFPLFDSLIRSSPSISLPRSSRLLCLFHSDAFIRVLFVFLRRPVLSSVSGVHGSTIPIGECRLQGRSPIDSEVNRHGRHCPRYRRPHYHHHHHRHRHRHSHRHSHSHRHRHCHSHRHRHHHRHRHRHRYRHRHYHHL